jgi:hypothetical protein
MQRELIEQDFEGLAELTRDNFVEPYGIVRALCADLAKGDASERTASLVYALTMGIAQFRAIGTIVSPRSARWNDPNAMALLVLTLIFPQEDWSGSKRKRIKRR